MEAVRTKKTTELLRDLKRSAHFEDYLKKNAGSMRQTDFITKLETLCKSSGKKKAGIARDAGISEVYLYQILKGSRIPSRNRVICVCCSLNTGLEETQNLLRLCGHAMLYPRDKRDALILHGLMHGATLSEINDALFEHGEEPLMD